jgi:hypothetical protein
MVFKDRFGFMCDSSCVCLLSDNNNNVLNNL